ncbi:hypothetical protein J4526_07960 [Desulfurococcaceae archaeon MEX13E-LK6-19]|nr:hypothetical protein J4526_07960 [Desulfurococcaceae archaeon MEX13E-LK6-19]
MPKSFSWGIQELDELYGPVPGGYVILIEGLPGTGKTAFSLQLATANALQGDKVLYILTNEDAGKLLKVAESIGLDLKELINKKLINIISLPMINDTSIVDFLSKSIMERVIGGAKIVIIDSITPLVKILRDYGMKRSFLHTALYQVFKQEDLLLVLIADTLSYYDEDVKLLEYIADIVIELSASIYGEKSIVRKLVVKKFRGKTVNVYKLFIGFTNTGIKILSYVSNRIAEKILTRRKPVEVECSAARKIFGSRLLPGTQILIHFKGPVSGARNFIKYVQKLIEKSVALQGYNCALISFTTRTLVKIDDLYKESSEFIREHVLEEKKALGDKLLIYRLDPGLSSGEDLLTFEREIVVSKDVGIVVIHGLEKFVQVYGEEAIDIHVPYILNVLRRLGTIGIRVFVSPVETIRPPRAYYLWCDLTIEVYPGKDGEYMIKSIKGIESVEVKDSMFKECIEKNTI